MKTCTVCHVEKPLTEFFRNRRSKDGLLCRCKVCHKALIQPKRDEQSRLVAERHRARLAAGTKDCTKCGATKPFSDFYPQRNGFGGVRGDCRACVNLSIKERVAQDPEKKRQQDKEYRSRPDIKKRLQEARKDWWPGYYAKNKAKIALRAKVYNSKKPKKGRDRLSAEYRLTMVAGVLKKKCTLCQVVKERGDYYESKGCKDGLNGRCKQCIRSRVKKRWQGSKEKVNSYVKRRKEYDPTFRLSVAMRSMVSSIVRKSTKNPRAKTFELVGCSPEELRKHLESKFKDGMSWENYGRHGWHVDHIRPIASFSLEDEQQQRECFNWRNLQPLWASENYKKGARF